MPAGSWSWSMRSMTRPSIATTTVDTRQRSQFRTSAFSLRYAGDESIGFEFAPSLNTMMQRQQGELVRPDGVTADDAMEAADVTTTTTPPGGGCSVTGSFTAGGTTVDFDGADEELTVRPERDGNGRIVWNEYQFRAQRWDDDTSTGFRFTVEATEVVDEDGPQAGSPVASLDILDAESDLESANRSLAAARFTSRGFGDGTWEFDGASGFALDAVLPGSVPTDTAQVAATFECE